MKTRCLPIDGGNGQIERHDDAPLLDGAPPGNVGGFHCVDHGLFMPRHRYSRKPFVAGQLPFHLARDDRCASNRADFCAQCYQFRFADRHLVQVAISPLTGEPHRWHSPGALLICKDSALASRRSRPNLDFISRAHSQALRRLSSAIAFLSSVESDSGHTTFCPHFLQAMFGRPFGSIKTIILPFRTSERPQHFRGIRSF